MFKPFEICFFPMQTFRSYASSLCMSDGRRLHSFEWFLCIKVSNGFLFLVLKLGFKINRPCAQKSHAAFMHQKCWSYWTKCHQEIYQVPNGETALGTGCKDRSYRESCVRRSKKKKLTEMQRKKNVVQTTTRCVHMTKQLLLTKSWREMSNILTNICFYGCFSAFSSQFHIMTMTSSLMHSLYIFCWIECWETRKKQEINTNPQSGSLPLPHLHLTLM